MSLARKCDRCEKLFEPKFPSSGHAYTYHNVSVTIKTNDKVLDILYNVDLCPECYEEFRKWMEMEENNGNNN